MVIVLLHLKLRGWHFPFPRHNSAFDVIRHRKGVSPAMVTIVDCRIRVLFVFVHKCKFFLCKILDQHHIQLLLFFLLYLLLLFLFHLFLEHLLEPILFLAHQHVLHFFHLHLIIGLVDFGLPLRLALHLHGRLWLADPLMLVHLNLFRPLFLLMQGLSSDASLGLTEHLGEVDHQGVL